MINNFRIAVEAVVPIFFFIFIGMGARRMSILSDSELNHVNKAIFRVMFPFMMFYNIYSADLSGIMMPSYFAFSIIMLLVIYFLGVVVALTVEKDNQNRGALIQAVFRGNIVLMGLPIMQNLMGDEALGLTALVLAMVVPIYNILAVVTLEFFRGGQIRPGAILKKIATNPLILGAVTGVLAVSFGIRLPVMLEKPIGQIASAATPVSLMVLGASFHFSSVKDNLRNICIGVAGKILVAPGLALTAGYLLGFRGLPLAVLIVQFGAPSAISGYTMAQQMDSNAELAAGCLIFSSMLSCITICMWIFIFKQLGAF